MEQGVFCADYRKSKKLIIKRDCKLNFNRKIPEWIFYFVILLGVQSHFTINLKNLIQLLEAVNKLPYGNKMFLSPEEEELMKNGSHELKYMSYPQVF